MLNHIRTSSPIKQTHQNHQFISQNPSPNPTSASLHHFYLTEDNLTQKAKLNLQEISEKIQEKSHTLPLAKDENGNGWDSQIKNWNISAGNTQKISMIKTKQNIQRYQKSTSSLANIRQRSKTEISYHSGNFQRPKVLQTSNNKKYSSNRKKCSSVKMKAYFNEETPVIPEMIEVRKSQVKLSSNIQIPTAHIDLPYTFKNTKNNWLSLLKNDNKSSKFTTKRVHDSLVQKKGALSRCGREVAEDNNIKLRNHKKSKFPQQTQQNQIVVMRTSPIKIQMLKLKRLIHGQQSYFQIGEQCQIKIRGLTRNKTLL